MKKDRRKNDVQTSIEVKGFFLDEVEVYLFELVLIYCFACFDLIYGEFHVFILSLVFVHLKLSEVFH